MTHYTTIEIDEVEVNVLIEFENHFGFPEITKTTDLATGCAICPELFDERLSDDIHRELHEVIADTTAEKLAEKNARWNANYFDYEY